MDGRGRVFRPDGEVRLLDDGRQAWLSADRAGLNLYATCYGSAYRARLLFGNPKAGAAALDGILVQLDGHLKLRFGMQVLEDALCNWQKSPSKFVPFRG